MQILLIEDNVELAASVGDYMSARGKLMDYAYDGLSGLQLAESGNYDVIVMDIGLPGINGLEVSRRLREESNITVPILILTARDTLEDKIEGLRVGGDDYLVKPFAMAELEARLEALVRRSRGQSHSRLLCVADLSYNLDTLEVHRAGRPLILKPSARKILEILMRNSHRIVSKTELEQALWGDDPPDADALRVHIHSLRNAIDGPFDDALLTTIRGSGYRLAIADENQSR